MEARRSERRVGALMMADCALMGMPMAKAKNDPFRQLQKNSAALAISLSALQEALRRSLLRSCKAGDASAELKWFSELDADLIHRAKQTVTEGLAMTDEAIIIDQAIDYLRFVFKGVRRDVVSKTKGK